VVSWSSLRRFEAFRGSRETRRLSDGRAATSRRRGDGVDVAGTPSRRHRLDGVMTIREASRESREVRMASNLDQRPLSWTCDGHEDAAIVRYRAIPDLDHLGPALDKSLLQ
jgi:hypothetical protein